MSWMASWLGWTRNRPVASQITTPARIIIRIPLAEPKPPGIRLRSFSWPRRMTSSMSGGRREPNGPPPPRLPPPHGPPPPPPPLPPPPHGPPLLLLFQAIFTSGPLPALYRRADGRSPPLIPSRVAYMSRHLIVQSSATYLLT